MTAALGLNVSPGGGLATPAELHAIGCTAVRLPAWPDHPMRTIVRDYVDAGITPLVCMDSRSYSVSNDPRRQAEYWRAEIGDLVGTVQVGENEYDATGATSSTASEQEVFEQLKAARSVFANHRLVGPNCASGQPDRWTKRLDDLVDVVALSRYPKTVEQMGDGIYGPFGYARFGKPVWIGEFPVWKPEYVTAALQHAERAYAYCWRSWWQNEGAHWDEGLLDMKGQPTWRMETFKHFARESDMAVDPGVEARLKLLEKQQGLTVDLIARVLTDKWDEGAESAEALLQAVAPEKYGHFQAVKFPGKA